MKKKVVRVITRLNVGGPAKHVAWLSDQLGAKGWEHKLLFGPIEENENDMSFFCAQRNVPMKELSHMKREVSLTNDTRSVFSTYAMLKRERPDLVHTHTAKAGMVGRTAALLYKVFHNRAVKIVHTFHGHSFHGYFSRPKERLFLLIERSLAKWGTHTIITISDAQQKEILGKYKVGKPNQHRIINLGIDTSFANTLDKQGLRKEFGIDADAKVFGIVGRIAPIKNHSLFIESIAAFNKIYTGKEKVFFLIVGDGDERELHMLRTQVAENKLTNVVFAGNQNDPSYFYGAMDYLALTSKNEGTPVSILESFAANIPVIATSVGGVPDLIGEDERGKLVEQKPEALAKGYVGLLAGEGNSKLENARNFVMKKYSVQNLVNKIDQLYLELLGQTK